MEKVYQVRFLLSLEPPKEGDIVSPPGGGTSMLYELYQHEGITKGTLFMRHLRTKKMEMNILGVRKYVAYLTSTTLKIGDLAFATDKEMADTIADEKDLTYHTAIGSYKIIGEISLDAALTLKHEQVIKESEWRGPIINRDSFKARYFIQIKDKDGNFK